MTLELNYPDSKLFQLILLFKEEGMDPMKMRISHTRKTENDTHSGVSAREFVICKLQQLPPLAPLVLLLKSYLHHKQLNNVYFGGLASYSLTLMLVFYLEQCFPSALDLPIPSIVLEPIDTLCSFTEESFEGEGMIKRAKAAVNKLLRLLETAGSPNLGTLLIGFLHYFGLCIDFTRMRIILQQKDGNAGGIFCQNERQRSAPLWIEDPLRPGVNVGSGSFAMCHVQACFVEMLRILTTPLPELLELVVRFLRRKVCIHVLIKYLVQLHVDGRQILNYEDVILS